MMANDVRRFRAADSTGPREVSRDVARHQRLPDTFWTVRHWLRRHRSRSMIVGAIMSARRGKRLRCLNENLLSAGSS